jgi:hypothetical protein
MGGRQEMVCAEFLQRHILSSCFVCDPTRQVLVLFRLVFVGVQVCEVQDAIPVLCILVKGEVVFVYACTGQTSLSERGGGMQVICMELPFL